MSERRVVVVGAGPGGLAAAILLAAAGVEVTVLERQPRVGGRSAALEADGFRFDLGPTFFLYPRVLAEIFAAAGADLFREVEMVRLDPQYRLVFGAGGSLDATGDLAEMERRVAALSPPDAGAITAWLAANRDKLAAFQPILQSPFESWRDLLRPEVRSILPLVRPWQSLEAELAEHFSDERLRIAFSFQSKYLGMSPARCPSLFSILAFLEYEYGVWHPIGGCSAVAEAMARLARRLGVDVRLGEEVEEILFHGRRAVGVRTAGAVHAADAVVVNADFARAMERLVPPALRRRWSDDRLARKRFSCSAFMLYLGVEGLDRDLPHHTIYVSRDYRENLRDIEERQVLSADPSFYVQNAGVTDPTLAPAGRSTLYVLVPVPHETPNVDWRREAGRFRDLVVSRLARAGFLGVDGRIVHETMITPDDWRSGFEIYRGATFNLAHDFSQMLHRRPHNRFEETDGLYLVGGGTHPGSGLPVIYESARISTRLLLEDLGVGVAAEGVSEAEASDAGWLREAV